VDNDYSPDTPLNRVLKAAIHRVLRLSGVRPRIRRTLRLQLSALDDVVLVDPDLTWADRWTPTRLDRRYLPAVRPSAIILCRIALAGTAGNTPSRSFLVDMKDLFERFLEEGLPAPVELTAYGRSSAKNTRTSTCSTGSK